MITLGISITAGITGGFICSLSFFQPVHSLFRDDEHFYHSVSKMPKEWLVGGDEDYDLAKATLDEIKTALIARKYMMEGN